MTGLNDGKEMQNGDALLEGSTPFGDRRQPSGNYSAGEGGDRQGGEGEDGGPFKESW